MNKKSLFFLESEAGRAEPDKALFHIIPVPLEKTVSYGKGAALGPEAIIEASQQLEAFDGVSVPLIKGIYTHDSIDCSSDCTDVLVETEKVISDVLKAGKIPVVLGGEHTISYAPAVALKKHFGQIGVIHFDAHADLRDELDGTKYSHACVMRRIHERHIPLMQIGTRSYSTEELQYRKEHKDIIYYDAADIYSKSRFTLDLPDDFPVDIYISIDVDGFDPSVIPHTGTPVPGGLLWYDFFRFIQSIPETRKIRGFDLVELAPDGNSRMSDFAAAQIVYNLIGIISRRI